MTIPMIGIFVMAVLAIVLGVFCMISELWQLMIDKKHNKICDEIPEGYWKELENYLVSQPPLPPESEENDPEPLI